MGGCCSGSDQEAASSRGNYEFERVAKARDHGNNFSNFEEAGTVADKVVYKLCEVPLFATPGNQ